MTTKAIEQGKCRCSNCKFSRLLIRSRKALEFAPYFCLKDRRTKGCLDEIVCEAIKYVWTNIKITKDNVAAVACYALNIYEMFMIRDSMNEDLCFNDIFNNELICTQHSHPARLSDIEYFYIENDNYDPLFKIYEHHVEFQCFKVLEEEELKIEEENEHSQVLEITNFYDLLIIEYLNDKISEDDFNKIMLIKRISIDWKVLLGYLLNRSRYIEMIMTITVRTDVIVRSDQLHLIERKLCDLLAACINFKMK